MKRAFMAWTICVLILSGFRPSQAQADHYDSYCLIEEEADSVRNLIDEMRDDFRRQFHCSSVYRPLMSVSNDAEALARSLRISARSGRPICEIKSELTALSTSVNEMRGLIEEAKFRAARGLDRPIEGCTKRIDERMSIIWHKSRYMLRMLDAAESAASGPGPYTLGRHSIGGYRDFGFGSYDPSYYDRRMKFEGTPRSDRMSRYGWDQMASSSSRDELPLGVFGPRGNGFEMSDDGITLRLGSSSIRVR